MVDFKGLAENILADLMNNVSISDILLKTKIFASKRGDEELLTWVTNELDGYEDKPPKYRIVKSGVKVNVFIPGRYMTVEFHPEMIEDLGVSERLSNMPFHNPIAELSTICKDGSDDGSLVTMHVPVYVYPYINDYINGDIQDVYQYTTKAAVAQIIVAVKSVLIDYLLKVSNEKDIDFSTFIKNNPKMNKTTIIAGVVHTGSGDVNAQGSTNIIGDNNNVYNCNKEELLKILAEIDKMAEATKPNPDYEELVDDIRKELEKEQPEKKNLKRFFQLIPTFLSGIASSVAGNGLTELISSAIALL